MLLAVGLFLLRVAGGAPLWEQVRAIRHWSSRQWIRVGVVAAGFVAWLTLELVDKLLSLPRWMHATILVIIAGLLLWPNAEDRSVLWNQIRAMGHWRSRQWIGFGLAATALVGAFALLAVDPLLSLSRIHYWLLYAVPLVTIAGLLLWHSGQDRSAQS